MLLCDVKITILRKLYCDCVMLGKPDVYPHKRVYKYEVRQTDKGAQVTVRGDAIDEIVADYARLRLKLESEGFKVASDE